MYSPVDYLISLANASIKALSPFGGDSLVMFRYAVLNLSVESSSNAASVVVD